MYSRWAVFSTTNLQAHSAIAVALHTNDKPQRGQVDRESLINAPLLFV